MVLDWGECEGLSAAAAKNWKRDVCAQRLPLP